MTYLLQPASKIDTGVMFQVDIEYQAPAVIKASAIEEIRDAAESFGIVATNTQSALQGAQHGLVIVHKHDKLSRVHSTVLLREKHRLSGMPM
jgi:hypothetical protein